MGTDTSSQVALASTTFGGESTVYHITNQTTSKGKTRSSEEWVNLNNVYINGRDTWYKADLEKLTGHSYADLTDAIMNNRLIHNPSDTLVNAYKMKRNKKEKTYTLTANIKDKDLMKKQQRQSLILWLKAPTKLRSLSKFKNMASTRI